MITSIILSIAYGKEISGLKDVYVLVAQQAMEGLSKATIAGVHLVEYLPFLQYLPSWLPGMGSMRLVEQYLPYVSDMRDKLYREVKAAVVSSITCLFHCGEIDLNAGQRDGIGVIGKRTDRGGPG